MYSVRFPQMMDAQPQGQQHPRSSHSRSEDVYQPMGMTDQGPLSSPAAHTLTSPVQLADTSKYPSHLAPSSTSTSSPYVPTSSLADSSRFSIKNTDDDFSSQYIRAISPPYEQQPSRRKQPDSGLDSPWSMQHNAPPTSTHMGSLSGGMQQGAMSHPQEQHLQQIFEKKRRRRESHNAVERRRRDNINERIYELASLLPDSNATKNNKGTILKQAVDYIGQLKSNEVLYQKQAAELEGIIRAYERQVGRLGLQNGPGGSGIDLNGIYPTDIGSLRRD